MKRSDRVLSRLERAGGAVTEGNIGIMLGDARRAVVRIQNGEDAELVCRELERQQREVLG